MNELITVPIQILSRKWANGIAPRWGDLFSRREEGWLTIHPGKLTVQSFCRNGDGTIVGADHIEVTNCKTLLHQNRFLKVTGDPIGVTNNTNVIYPVQEHGYSVTMAFPQEYRFAVERLLDRSLSEKEEIVNHETN